MTRTPTIAAAPPHPHTPRCPRCGYDLAGVPPTWTTQCPLVGTCSECGLHVEWARVMNPRLEMPRWLYEGGRSSGWNALCRLASTSARTLLPTHFWRSVRLDHPVRPLRLFEFALTWILLTPLFLIASELLLNLIKLTRGTRVYWNELLDISVAPAGAVAAMVVLVAPALWLALLPHSRRAARVRLVHLARVTVYGMPGVIMIVAVTRWWHEAAFQGLVPNIVSPGYLLDDLGGATAAALFAWSLVWWLAACGLYMRLPKWGAVVACLTVMTMLAYLAAGVILMDL